ncbi:hypothetical protein LEN26_015890 [Aphanomyces euteiches]|nr:hypothetical protein LEN26_015890 [Aphanomyces euteiches]
MMLQVICFSMDRPWQLSEYLRTLQKFLSVDLTSVWVLYKTSESAFRDGYDRVMEMYPTVQWTEEAAGVESSFGHGLLSILNAPTSDYILFGVDDAFFFDYFPLMDILRRPSVWNVLHLTLNPNIWYSETQQAVALPLPSMIHHGDIIMFDSTGRGEWNYPWEVSGSVYLRQRVMDVLEAIQDKYGLAGISQPNRLENNGALVQLSFQWREACTPKPIMHVMAINQVQQIYDNPLLAQHETKYLLLHLSPLRHLDTTFYRNHVFRSVHIGALKLVDETDSPQQTDPLVSVILPAYNESRFIIAALDSLAAQTYRNFEVLVLDDCSTDDTAALVQNYPDPRIRLIQNETNSGVAKTLNHGLALARGDFIARMDADDVALPNRLEMQVAYLLAHPDVDLIGSAIGVIGESKSPYPCKVIVYPTSLHRTHWAMFMGCMLAHPTVLFRRNHTIATFRYAEDFGSGEDYDMWLRLLQAGVKMRSLGTPLLLHRKHGSNASTLKRDQQRQEANTAAHKAIMAFLGHPVKLEAVLLLRAHTLHQDLGEATSLLDSHAEEAIQIVEDLKRRCLETSDDQERAAIESEAMSRHGEIAFRAMIHDPTKGVMLWQKWVQAYPVESRQVFERLAKHA